ncbi:MULTISPECIES: lysylphosphatidylglycerol synthase transmembrane domain-containing protein [Deefgea]|uniref:Flippase-like domain-containing protein n=1 Tax=Deefgea chitinilytica TaxID=570276 RepID=A0ABS2C962_9NEIS|nr:MULTISPECIES: lysylphosphatidylglycerol synthase transmembrane domain-containing protein [Deefgea]MBM5570023.1 flippase-like domain-containing protein [Deefgea chitinilytica]MBM9887252.1 flippase-like domain-containing protein [Deefgea sp. CFH1-16]
MKKISRTLIGAVVAVFFVWLIFKNVNFHDLIVSFKQVKIPYIAGVIFVFFAGYCCRLERWRLMLLQENPRLQWKNCSGPLMASVAANNILPFRAGDILRAFAFNSRLEISASTSLTSLFVERLLDLLMVVSSLGIALTYFGMDSSALVGVEGSVLIFAAIAILFLLFFPGTFKKPAFFIADLIYKLNTRLGTKFKEELLKIFVALGHTSQRTTIIKLVLWSFIAWISEGLVFWFVALSLPDISNDLASWVALPVGTLATVIPSTPGYVGTFDYFTAQSMIAMGNSTTSSVAFAFIVHAVLWLPPSLAGGIYLIANPIKIPKN